VRSIRLAGPEEGLVAGTPPRPPLGAEQHHCGQQDGDSRQPRPVGFADSIHHETPSPRVREQGSHDPLAASGGVVHRIIPAQHPRTWVVGPGRVYGPQQQRRKHHGGVGVADQKRQAGDDAQGTNRVRLEQPIQPAQTVRACGSGRGTRPACRASFCSRYFWSAASVSSQGPK
jgi:hypothetical protein